MKIYSVYDEQFKEYGFVLEGYDYSELFKNLANIDLPADGIVYMASVEELESCAVAKEMEVRGFGGYPVQLGCVVGHCRTMNCLEYHKSSEYNIAMNDIILILGREQDIADGKYDSSLCKAFLVPAGVGVELYGTTLHYAPFNVNDDGYGIICVLPRGTNAEKIEFTARNYEDKMCRGVNKWLLAHPDAPEAKEGAYVGITGKNIKFEDLEG